MKSRLTQKDRIYAALEEGAATSTELAATLKINRKHVSSYLCELIGERKIRVIGYLRNPAGGQWLNIVGRIEMYPECQ